MNLNELWNGTDYAYFPQRKNQEVYRRFNPQYNERNTYDKYSENGFAYYAYTQVYRVKIIQKIQKQEPGNKRMTGYAQVLYVDPETGDPLENDDGTHKIEEVRARDIATRWEEYWDEHEHREAERELREEKEKLEREARQREYEERARIERERREREQAEQAKLREERLAKEAEKKQALVDWLERAGVPQDAYSIYTNYIEINRHKLELALAEGTVCQTES